MGDSIDRRLDKLERELGDDGDQDAPYRPTSVIALHFTRRWHSQPDDDDEGTPESHEVKREHEARLDATHYAIVEWAVADARKHDYREPWHLAITFHDADLEPERARFTLPWHPGPWRDVYAKVIAELDGGDGYLEWPDCAQEKQGR